MIVNVPSKSCFWCDGLGMNLLSRSVGSIDPVPLILLVPIMVKMNCVHDLYGCLL